MALIKSVLVCAVLLICCGGCLVVGNCDTGAPASAVVYGERPVPAGKSLVYIYREPHTAGSVNVFRIFANGKEITRVGNGGYYDYTVDPSHIDFTWLVIQDGLAYVISNPLTNSGGPFALCSLDAEAGNVYYLRFELGPPQMRQVFKEDAVKAMTGMHRFADIESASN